MANRQRTSVPKDVQVEVFFRDAWLCYLCRRPTLFPPAFRLLSEMVGSELPGVPLAFWDPRWRRDQAPLLDELAVCLDHVHPFADGVLDIGRAVVGVGMAVRIALTERYRPATVNAHEIDNFATACARCNARKSARSKETFLEISSPWVVSGRHGEPEHWDGLASLFVVLARKLEWPLTPTEKDWLRALEARYSAQRGR